MKTIRSLENILKYRAIRYVLLISYLSLIFYLCLIPGSNFPKNEILDEIHFDKWVHIMFFFGLWSLSVWAYKQEGVLANSRNKVFIGTFLWALFVGILIEILQELTGRSMDIFDVVADMAGAFLAYWFWIKFEHKWWIYRT
ncbi:MAG: VanZ family protein [Chitinophagales bacterium]|nr:VanZ family protein [Chitinophagales bacterium]